MDHRFALILTIQWCVDPVVAQALSLWVTLDTYLRHVHTTISGPEFAECARRGFSDPDLGSEFHHHSLGIPPASHKPRFQSCRLTNRCIYAVSLLHILTYHGHSQCNAQHGCHDMILASFKLSPPESFFVHVDSETTSAISSDT